MVKSIGVGCFYFGISKSVKKELKVSEHLRNIKSALEEIASIGEIEVSFEETFDDLISLPLDPVGLNNNIVFPHIEFFRIDFSLHIPARIQESVLEESWAFERSGTENFKVSIVSSFYGPVTFVECVESEVKCDPSYSVRVVRAFLDSEFRKLNENVVFEYMGPSPFHANLFLAENSEKKEGVSIEVEEIHTRGYNDIILKYNPNKFDSEEEVYEFLISEVDNELGLFYKIVRIKNSQRRAWSDISEKVQSLKHQEIDKIRWWSFSKRLRLLRTQREIIDKLYQFKAENEEARTQVKEWIDDTYTRQLEVYFESYVRAREAKFPSYPIDAIIEWIRHNEARSLKYIELSTVFISALFGGVVGSLITALIQL